MPAALIASAFLLSGFGCIMPIAWVTEIRALKLGVFVAWVVLIAVAVLMGSLYPGQLVGANPLLKVGLESICLVCAVYPLFGIATTLVPHSVAQISAVTILALLDLLVATVGYGSLLFGTFWLIFF